MRRNPFAPWSPLVVLSLLAFGSPAHAATSCAAGNPNTTSVIEWTPTSDFTVNGDGTVTHAKTGLMWKQCAEGLSGAACATGTATTMTWANALNAAKTANTAAFAGYTDWRLPNKKELESIVESCGYNPSINRTVFPATPPWEFWSSSSVVSDPSRAWSVYFGYGSTRDSDKANDPYISGNAMHARLVRGGQSVDYFDLFAYPTSTHVSDCVFNWAERTYPNWFAPAGVISNTAGPYYFRYYAQTNAYLATSSADDHVYYFGPVSNNSIFDVGALLSLLSTAGCQ